MKKTKAKPKSNRKSSPAAKALGASILADLKEFADALEAGIPLASKYTIRRVQIPDAPSQYKPGDVRETRDKIGVSQSVFSHLLGVSTILVQAWEQGNRIPAPWARRLLDEMNHDPKRWRAMVKKAS
jgi:DNA-binding transcriptional regulator YiaG